MPILKTLFNLASGALLFSIGFTVMIFATFALISICGVFLIAVGFFLIVNGLDGALDFIV